MELNEILSAIKQVWSSSEQSELIIDLEQSSQGASTGSEGLIQICQFIRGLRSTNKIAYDSVEQLAEQLFSYERKAFKKT